VLLIALDFLRTPVKGAHYSRKPDPDSAPGPGS